MLPATRIGITYVYTQAAANFPENETAYQPPPLFGVGSIQKPRLGNYGREMKPLALTP
jgi:hypothetical protein